MIITSGVEVTISVCDIRFFNNELFLVNTFNGSIFKEGITPRSKKFLLGDKNIRNIEIEIIDYNTFKFTKTDWSKYPPKVWVKHFITRYESLSLK
ncbi:MAG: hypothetical protein ABI045_06180 [Flavobacteriales bacterium]